MNTHNICLYGELKEITLYLSSATHFICFSLKIERINEECGLHRLFLTPTTIAYNDEQLKPYEPRHDKMRLREFRTRPDTNWPAQPQKLATVFKILAIESSDIMLSKQRTTKALIRLCGCAGWSASLLFAYDIRHIFPSPGSYPWNIELILYTQLSAQGKRYGPEYAKTNKITCAPSEDSDQPGYPPSLIRVFAVRSKDS